MANGVMDCVIHSLPCLALFKTCPPFPKLLTLHLPPLARTFPLPPHTLKSIPPFQLMQVIALVEELRAKAAAEEAAAAAAVVAAAALSEGPLDDLPEVSKRGRSRPPSTAPILGPSSAALDQSQNTAVLKTLLLRSELKRERAAAAALAVQVAAEWAELETKLAAATAGREAAEQQLRDQAAAHRLRDQAAAQQLLDQAAAQGRMTSGLKAGLRARRDLMRRQSRVCEALWARCGQLLSRGVEVEVGG